MNDLLKDNLYDKLADIEGKAGESKTLEEEKSFVFDDLFQTIWEMLEDDRTGDKLGRPVLVDYWSDNFNIFLFSVLPYMAASQSEDKRYTRSNADDITLMFYPLKEKSYESLSKKDRETEVEYTALFPALPIPMGVAVDIMIAIIDDYGDTLFTSDVDSMMKRDFVSVINNLRNEDLESPGSVLDLNPKHIVSLYREES